MPEDIKDGVEGSPSYAIYFHTGYSEVVKEGPLPGGSQGETYGPRERVWFGLKDKGATRWVNKDGENPPEVDAIFWASILVVRQHSY